MDDHSRIRLEDQQPAAGPQKAQGVADVLDIGAQMSHGALRAYVMGEAALEREASDDESAEMGLLKRDGKKRKPGLKIGFTGCVAQQDREEVFKGAPHLDFVLGTDSLDQLPEVLFRVEKGEEKVMQVGP